MSASTKAVLSQPEPDDDWNYDESEGEPDRTCQNCKGTGGDPWNDGILPCEDCDGEGYRWWE